ncbi:MAG: hypothetical protein AAGB00_01240 [Planctomycetota bacterium]
MLAVAVFGLLAAPAAAQVSNNWTNPGVADWNVGGNWSEGFAPSSSTDEVANISNGGTAFLNTAAVDTPGEVVLGENTGQTGNLEIRSGGSLSVVVGVDANGGIDVGADGGGVGTLSVAPGGSLSVGAFFDVFSGSSVTLGGVGPGVTSVDAEFTNFTADLRVIGPNVDFASGTSLGFGPNSVYTAEITGPSHSPLRSSSSTLNGTLRVEFNGYTPSVGDAWDIVDAAGIGGQFTTLDTSAAPALNPGEAYRLDVEAGGARGAVARLKLDQVLTLSVERSTGALSIQNQGALPLSVDGYTVSSSLGQLNTTQWSTVETQLGSGWQEAVRSATRISELNPINASTIASGGSLTPSLGNLFSANPSAFGVDFDEDIGFEYTTPDGQIVPGLVEFIGAKRFNNLVLFVDPATGNARLRNDSQFFSVEIDGYTIGSASGSLLDTYNSLQDQGVGAWFEADPTANELSELRATDAETFVIGKLFDLGNVFDQVSGTQDLTFQYLLPGETEPVSGVVVYTAFDLEGDYNDDGVVDAADYTVWRDNLNTTTTLPNDLVGGTIGVAQYLQWRSNFGAERDDPPPQGAALLASAPEPSSAALVALAVCVVPGRLARRFRPERDY